MVLIKAALVAGAAGGCWFPKDPLFLSFNFPFIFFQKKLSFYYFLLLKFRVRNTFYLCFLSAKANIRSSKQ